MMRMRTISWAIAALAIASTASAQQVTSAQRDAIKRSCRSDYQANCASVPTGGSAALACLQQHADSLSPPCRDAVAAVGGGGSATSSAPSSTQGAPPAASHLSQREQLAVLRADCGADYRRLCRGVRPGGGRAIGCLQDHAQSLSEQCRGALSHAGM
jgi:hypothetical protein